MLLAIEKLLSRAEAAAIRAAASTIEFGDGATTAGRHARAVKANAQALPSPGLDAIRAKATAALEASALFRAAARPRHVTPLILSRYRQGQTYGTHVDDAMMGGLRTDISFTLFLSEPESYDGGELVLEDMFEPRAIRLGAGDLFLYPSTALHRVEPVTRGERLALVGWVQSLIREPGRREILFDLDRSVEQIHAEQGPSELFHTLAKTRSNLMRLWVSG
ncbi:MAG: Fe2+-dependent dioxygenase [Pseudomonadota bacterium]